MRIAICDDEKDFLDEFASLFHRYQDEYKEDIQLVSFNSGKKFLDYFQKYRDIVLIFLDIHMELDGLSTAKLLRNMDAKIKIVFLTSHVQYAVQGYTVQAAGYILKPLEYKQFCQVLGDTIKAVKAEELAYIIVKNDSGIYKIYYDSIIYIETFHKNVLIHTCEEEVVSYRRMKDYDAELDERFYRVHAGYIVNMKYIANVRNLDIRLMNGEYIPISQPRKSKFSKALAAYNCMQL